MQNPWTAQDDALLQTHYKQWSGAGPLDLPQELLERHSFNACRARASRLGVTRKCRPRQPDVKFKLQRSDAAYLAGLIDGEGHVSGTQPMLQITTTTPEITDWLLATVPVGRLQKNRLTSTGKTIYRWYLSTQFGCDRLYRQVLPHIKIIEKRERMAKFTGLSYS